MTLFRASGTEETDDLEEERSVESELQNFKAIRNPALRIVMRFLPWFILFIVLFILVNLELRAGVVMYISGMLAAALSLLAFYRLMTMIPDAFRTLWSREIIVEEPSPDSFQKIIGEQGPEALSTVKKPEIRFRRFIERLKRMINHRLQWVTGVCFSLLVFTWDYSHEIEFFIAFIIGLMAWKMAVTSIYVWKLGKEFHLEPLIGHADKAGGLSPLGSLCLWNALIVTIPAVHLGGWILIGFVTAPYSPYYLQAKDYTSLYFWLLFIPLAFAIITFFLPLWKVHLAMKEWNREKQEQLCHLEHRIHLLESEILSDAGNINQEEYEKLHIELELMQQVCKQSRKLPVWPFNLEIKMTFIISQIVPFLGIISQVISWIKHTF